MSKDTLKIKFKKEYPEDTTWLVILDDFLKHLSEKFSYDIDAYDLLRLPTALRREAIGKLLNENPESETYQSEFNYAVRRDLDERAKSDATREKMRKLLEAQLSISRKSMKNEF